MDTDWNQISESELALKIRTLAPAEISEIIRELNSTDKIRAAVIALDEKPQLEAIGRGLNARQCLELFSFFPNAVRKLSPIVVGLSHEVFRQVLLKGDESQLQALKQHSMAEPIIHQLKVYYYEITKRLDALNQKYEKLDTQMQNRIESPMDLWHELCQLSEDYHELMREINILLLLVWNTDRVELLESLTNSKEQCHRVCRFGVGFPGTENENASGLFQQLDEKLFSIYDPLLDDDPAIEGLGKLHAWYLQDYRDAGLLEGETDLDPSEHTQAERIAFRDKRYLEVQHNLARLGLVTVKDLKKAWIYSKDSLKTFTMSAKT